MSGGVVSKNLYEILGNDPELDPERATPPQPTKAFDKPVQRSGKRDAGPQAPVQPATTGGRNRGEKLSGNELAFRDGNAGRQYNRTRGPDDGLRDDRHRDHLRDERSGGPRGGGRGRGGRTTRGRGGGPGAPRDDRHSKSGVGEHAKQAGHGWGEATGEGEFADEKAGEAIAKQEEKQGIVADSTPQNDDGLTPDGEEAGEPEPEEKTMSYAAYQAQLAEKRAALSGNQSIRKANEGTKNTPEGKALERSEEDAYMAGSGGKKKRERERKEKATLELDTPYYEPADLGGRGGGRGGRGGRGRGEGRGRGGGRGRGEGGFRGRGRGASGPNLNDQSAFPSLGGS